MWLNCECWTLNSNRESMRSETLVYLDFTIHPCVTFSCFSLHLFLRPLFVKVKLVIKKIKLLDHGPKSISVSLAFGKLNYDSNHRSKQLAWLVTSSMMIHHHRCNHTWKKIDLLLAYNFFSLYDKFPKNRYKIKHQLRPTSKNPDLFQPYWLLI